MASVTWRRSPARCILGQVVHDGGVRESDEAPIRHKPRESGVQRP
jgi:hypothetical protein